MKICLMGVGNVLMGDDALGPHVLKRIEARYELPPEVTVFDAGTPGLDLTLFLDGFDAIVAIDALKARGAPGEIRTYREDQLVEGGLPIVMSPHEPTLREALMRLKLLGRGPAEVYLVGAIPQRVETGPGLSFAVESAIPVIEQHVLRELARLGAKVTPRTAPATPDVWWEAVAR
ncbi:MAG: hydrogenase maturation protease [Myxococcales bacterium]